ncbi:MAG: orotate phosphoribosyltransferase [Rhodospirillales bacterium]|nr:orotate phosphoribosyltransferase [Alphaproteobacteria bacterium]MCB9987027.1 orotate phosphoribosyltransferase [Rhodospirillales bacterium]USO08203.1 MAG: orotate phosphoribosyltransferase [Rhodospirillales bacterium]
MTAQNDIARETARILLDTQSVLIRDNPPFTYTSGRVGPVYVDCRRLISFPKERKTLMDFAAQAIRAQAPDTDVVAGGETAGIPYAAFIADRLEKPMIYVRKKAKGVGRNAQIEGHLDHGKRVLICEDLQNYGNSVKVFVDALRAADAIVEHVCVIFTYGHASAAKFMADEGLKLLALASWRDIIDLARAEKRFDEKMLASLESFLADPVAWSVAHGGKGEDASGVAA